MSTSILLYSVLYCAIVALLELGVRSSNLTDTLRWSTWFVHTLLSSALTSGQKVTILFCSTVLQPINDDLSLRVITIEVS